ncbi:MAG: hypothetical protein IKD70_00775 [Eggerthellaceae bacterium]|nr:hypothetical protein [Eggerthellaceae bacterium]
MANTTFNLTICCIPSSTFPVALETEPLYHGKGACREKAEAHLVEERFHEVSST